MSQEWWAWHINRRKWQQERPRWSMHFWMLCQDRPSRHGFMSSRGDCVLFRRQLHMWRDRRHSTVNVGEDVLLRTGLKVEKDGSTDRLSRDLKDLAVSEEGRAATGEKIDNKGWAPQAVKKFTWILSIKNISNMDLAYSIRLLSNLRSSLKHPTRTAAPLLNFLLLHWIIVHARLV